MKKLMMILVATLTLVACNNNAETTAVTSDSTAPNVDSVACANCTDSTAASTTTATAE